MGMFDDLIVAVPLPHITETDRAHWQTKDLDNQLETYKITAEGRLIKQIVRWDDARQVDVPTGEWRDVDFHGDLWFHGFADDKNCKDFRHFVSRFTEGSLVGVVQSEDYLDVMKPRAGFVPAPQEKRQDD